LQELSDKHYALRFNAPTAMMEMVDADGVIGTVLKATQLGDVDQEESPITEVPDDGDVEAVEDKEEVEEATSDYSEWMGGHSAKSLLGVVWEAVQKEAEHQRHFNGAGSRGLRFKAKADATGPAAAFLEEIDEDGGLRAWLQQQYGPDSDLGWMQDFQDSCEAILQRAEIEYSDWYASGVAEAIGQVHFAIAGIVDEVQSITLHLPGVKIEVVCKGASLPACWTSPGSGAAVPREMSSADAHKIKQLVFGQRLEGFVEDAKRVGARLKVDLVLRKEREEREAREAAEAEAARQAALAAEREERARLGHREKETPKADCAQQ